MSNTKYDLLSLRDGRIIRGTCPAKLFSFSTHDCTQGFSKGSLKRIQFGLGLDADSVELKSETTIKGRVLLTLDEKLFFKPEGENTQTFDRKAIECLEFREIESADPVAETKAITLLPDEDEDNGPACAGCGCTEDHPCPAAVSGWMMAQCGIFAAIAPHQVEHGSEVEW